MIFTKLSIAAGTFIFTAVFVKRSWKLGEQSETTYGKVQPESCSYKSAIKPWDHFWDTNAASFVQSSADVGSYSKLLIFVRHGQYNLRGPTADEKVLTELGWRQAYEAGRQLKRFGFKIDRIVHSDLIRARQTTAALLVGLQDDPEQLMDLPLLTNLSAPQLDTLHGNYALNSQTADQESHEVAYGMISPPYDPFPEAEFDCQQSRFLAEGPPPVAPEPPVRTSVTESVRQTEGLRLESGFQAHIHRAPVTSAGYVSHNAVKRRLLSPCTRCSCLSGLRSNCSCACHRIPNGDPCETIVFVGHANVFRFWLCRALQLPPEAWLRFRLYHGSISCLLITYEPQLSTRCSTLSAEDAVGRCVVSAERIGEIGHLGKELLSS